MAKKRKKRRAKKRSGGKPAATRSVSEAAIRVSERMVSGGPQYIRENMARWLQASAELRSEQEFAGFYLERRPLLEAARRRFPRFRRRVTLLVRRGKEVPPFVYDDYRIAVLGDLDTPALRKELQSRAARCFDRLKYGSDEAKIETAVYLSLLLDEQTGRILKRGKQLPLGIIGLVTALYEDSFERAMETLPGARQIVGDDLYGVWCDAHAERDRAELDALLQELPAFEELAPRIEGDSTLAWAWKRQAESLLDDLLLPMASGLIRFTPRFFAPHEIALAMDRMERQYWSKPWSVSRYLLMTASLNLLTCIRETVDEVMSEERMADLAAAFAAVGQGCFEDQEERKRSLVPLVQAAIDELSETRPASQSKVVQMLFLQELIETLNEAETLSPHWLRFSRRVSKSRLFGRTDVESR